MAKYRGDRRFPMQLWLDLLKTLPGWVSVSLAVYDQTVGYHREEQKIPVRKFKELTDLSRTGIHRAIKQAEAKRMITVTRANSREGLTWSRRVPIYRMNAPTKWLPRTAKVDNTGVTTKVDNTVVASSIGGKQVKKHTQGSLAVDNTGVPSSRQHFMTTNSDSIDTLIDTPIYNHPSTTRNTPPHTNSLEEFVTPPCASTRKRLL